MPSAITYKHIFVPIEFEFSQSSKRIIEKALDLQQVYNAKLTVAHFIESVKNLTNLYNVSFVDIESKLLEQAREDMQAFCEGYNIPIENSVVELGQAKSCILETAKKNHADLIVMGSHTHHGLFTAMLGSTVNAVSNHADCDILIVRAQKD